MMNFEVPEIKIIRFKTDNVNTFDLSGGYEDNETQKVVGWSQNVVHGGSDGDFAL